MLQHQPVAQSIYYGYPQRPTGIGPKGSAYAKLVSSADQAKIAAKEAALKSGSFDVYTGPISDQSGQVKVPAGQKLTSTQILSINWAVQGVIGNISKS